MTPVNGPRADGDSRFSSPARSLSKIGSLERYRAANPFESENEEDETMTQMSGSEDYLSADSETGQDRENAMLNVMDPAKQETASFSDFVQYDEHRPDTFTKFRVTPQSSPFNQRKVVFPPDSSLTESTDSPSMETVETLMQACVHCFQQLFCTFVNTRIMDNPDVAAMLGSQLHKVQSSLSGSDLPRVHVPPPSPQHRQRFSVVSVFVEKTIESNDRCRKQSFPIF